MTAARAQVLASALRHHQAGRLDEASEGYRRLYAANARDSDVIFLLGLLCCDLGLFQEARQFLERALAVTPAFPEARRQLAVALHALAGDSLTRGDASAAESLLLAAVAERADHAESWSWLGLARLQLGKHGPAENALERALDLDPAVNQARNNLGLTLRHQGRLDAARACFEEALARDPGYTHARINLAIVLRLQGAHAQAQQALESVLALAPDSVEALNNLGATFQDMGRGEAALKVLTRARDLAPNAPQIRWNLALTQLQLGDFTDGWSNFESRWEGCENLRGGYRLPAARAWTGQPLAGKRLLLWAEQGFGDTLQFIRFAQDTAARGASVSVQSPPELAALLKGAPGVGRVTAQDEVPSDYDFHCPLMSLPYRLGIALDVDALHGATPYLSADRQGAAQWRERLGRHASPRVGLVWAGSARRQSAELAAIDARRSIAPHRLGPILDVDGCSFFSLQKRLPTAAAGGEPDAAAPLAALAYRGLHDFTEEWVDFSDTAAFITHLDLVISVDTAVAHLAGALGKPVWLLNRHDCCWRWLLGRSDSPWYASLRQFRQPRAGDWPSVIDAVAAALTEVVAASRARHAPQPGP